MRSLGALLLLAGFVAGCGGGPQEFERDDETVFQFSGMEYFDEKDLLQRVARAEKQYRNEPRASVLDDVSFRIKQAYLLAGFYLISVEFQERDGLAIFEIREGVRFDLGRVHFVGNRFISDDELRKLKPGEPQYQRSRRESPPTWKS